MLSTLPTRSAAAILLVLSLAVTAGAQANKSSETIILVNPTPRPDDLQLKYGETPGSRKPVSRLSDAQLKAQNRKQIEDATGMILLLAQRMKTDLESKGLHAPAELTVRRANEIETLAKIVKDRMKQQ